MPQFSKDSKTMIINGLQNVSQIAMIDIDFNYNPATGETCLMIEPKVTEERKVSFTYGDGE